MLVCLQALFILPIHDFTRGFYDFSLQILCISYLMSATFYAHNKLLRHNAIVYHLFIKEPCRCNIVTENELH